MKKILLIMFCMIFLIGIVSSADWNNKLMYSEDDLKIELQNWWGLGKDYGSAELKSHPSVNYVRQVLVGNPVMMWYDFDFNELYENGLGEIEIKNMKNGKLINKNWEYVYWGNITYDVPIYSKRISENGTIYFEISGTEKRNEETWIDYNSRDLPNKKIRIGVRMDIGFEETIDIIWTIGGKKVTKHAVVTSGGVETTDGLFTVVTYLNNGTFNITGNELPNVEILVVGGGGGGGAGGSYGGGGGAGGIIHNSSVNLTIGNYDIIVGLGGLGVNITSGTRGQGSSFGNDLFFMNASGGGFGNGVNFAGSDGGSGGGGSGNGVGGTTDQGSVNGTGFGNDGGDGPLINDCPGGGGGSGFIGEDGQTPQIRGGNGGNGTAFNITNGTDIFYGGGGGGGGFSAGACNSGIGGIGGGGLGGISGNQTAGTNGTGAGGGGAGGSVTAGANGGSGIVIIRFTILDLTITLNSPIDNFNTTNATISFNSTVVSGQGIDNVSLYLNDVRNETNSSGINDSDYIFTKIISDGDNTWLIEACVTSNECGNSSSRSFSVDANAPILNITFPTETIDHHLINTNLSVNWTVSDLNLDTCILEYESVNTTVTCLDNQTNIINITNSINRTIIFYANDTFGNVNSSSRSWNYTVFENSQTFNIEVFEGSIESFLANLTIDPTKTIASTNLFYNGTLNTGSFSASGNDSLLTINKTIPVVPTDTNITFIWNVQLTDGQSINITPHNQTINIIALDDCSVNTVVLFNYTMVDEGNQSQINNTEAELSLVLFDLSRQNVIVNFSQTYTNINPFAVCLSEDLASSSFKADSVVRYQANAYSIENFNIANSTITNTTIPVNITLFDLALLDATEFLISFKGEDFVFVEDALIFIDRQYIAENNTFKTVEVPKTDSNGKTIGHFVRNDVVYNIRVVKENVVLGNFNNIIAFCTDFTIGDCQINLEATPSGLVTFSYDEELGIVFESIPTFNNDTNAISFSFSSTDGTPKTVFLSVERQDIFGNRTICNNTLTSSSGTLSCTIPSNLDDTILETNVFVNNELIVLSSIDLDSAKFGNLGFVLWFLITLTFIFIVNDKTEVLLGLFLSFVGAIALGITRGSIIGIGSSGIWILVIVILGIWKLNKEKPQ